MPIDDLVALRQYTLNVCSIDTMHTVKRHTGVSVSDRPDRQQIFPELWDKQHVPNHNVDAAYPRFLSVGDWHDEFH